MRLHGKSALITGGSRSIGRAIALAFAREGAAVAVGYRTHPEAADEVVRTIRDLGGRAVALQGDVSRRPDVNRMVDHVVEQFGRIDILVNNAAVLKRTPFLEITESEVGRDH